MEKRAWDKIYHLGFNLFAIKIRTTSDENAKTVPATNSVHMYKGKRRQQSKAYAE